MIDGEIIFIWILLAGLITCAIAAIVARKLITTVLIFMSYSVIMSVIWIALESPDLAGTEAAVGAGVTTILFFVVLKKVGVIDSRTRKDNEDNDDDTMSKVEKEGEDNE